MDGKLFEIKARIAAALSVLGALLGWQGVLASVWVCAMFLDYLTGSMVAWKSGAWSSAEARAGLWRKCGMIVAVIAAGVADGVFAVVMDYLPIGFSWPALTIVLCLAWYTLTELGSIFENIMRLGVPVPEWLYKLLKIGLAAINKAAEDNIEEE